MMPNTVLRRSAFTRLFAAGLTLTAYLASGAQAAQYTITALPTLGGSSSSASAINNKGQIVGSSYNASGQSKAFLYFNGGMTDLGDIPTGVGNVQATALNDNGQVVGWAYATTKTVGQLTNKAFLYSNGTMTDLGTLGGGSSFAWGINNIGQVVGSAGDTAGNGKAFLYRNGTMTSLGTLGGRESVANAVNDAGLIVGSATDTAGNYHPTQFGSPNVNLGDKGYFRNAAAAINASGQVAGSFQPTASYGYHAFLYINGTMTDLGAPFGGSLSEAAAINVAGSVVGYATDTSGYRKAFLYTAGGGMQNLNALIDPASGWSLQTATGINDSGQIIGLGYSSTYGTTAYLLTPVPEPTAAAVACLASVTLLRRTRVVSTTSN